MQAVWCSPALDSDKCSTRSVALVWKRSERACSTWTAIRISLDVGVFILHANAAKVFVRGLPVSCPTNREPLHMLGFFDGDWMCPRLTKAETSGDFLRTELRGRFNNCPQWVAVNPCVFSVGVVDAPKLIPWLRCPNPHRFHAASEHDAARVIVLDRHNLAARDAMCDCCVVLRRLIQVMQRESISIEDRPMRSVVLLIKSASTRN